MTALVLVAAAAFLAGSVVAAWLTRRHLTEDGIWGDNRRYHLDLDAERQQAAEMVMRAAEWRRRAQHAEDTGRQLVAIIVKARTRRRRSPVPRYGIHRRRLA